MSNNKVKKWVGIFLLAIVMIFGFTLVDVNFSSDNNVYAAQGCGTLRHKQGNKCVDGANTICKGKGKNRSCSCMKGYGKPNSSDPNCTQVCGSDEDTKGNYCKKKKTTSGSNSNGNSGSTGNNSNGNGGSSSEPTTNGNTTMDSTRDTTIQKDTKEKKVNLANGKTFTYSFSNKDDPTSGGLITRISSRKGVDGVGFTIKLVSTELWGDYLTRAANESDYAANLVAASGDGYIVTSNWTSNSYSISDDIAGQFENGYVVVIYPSASDAIQELYTSKTGKTKSRIRVVDDSDPKTTYTFKYTSFVASGSLRVESKLSDDVSGNVKSLSYDYAVCKWARDKIAEHQSDANYASFVKSVQNSMEPCLNEYVKYNLSKSTLKTLKGKLEELEKVYDDYVEQLTKTDGFNIFSDKLPDIDTTKWIKVSSTKLSDNNYKSESGSSLNTSGRTDMLTCDAKLTNEKTYKYLYYEVETPYKANMYNFSLNPAKRTEQTVCTTKCREQLYIAMDPPTAVYPGDCFTYRVEIKSTSTCIVKPDFDKFPKFPNYEPCDMEPYCAGNSTPFIHQAGPSADFDSCVSKCDGGEYTTSCVNKCYNSVYENLDNSDATTEKTSNDEDTEIEVNENNTLSYSNKDSVLNSVVKLANEEDTVDTCPTLTDTIKKNGPTKEYVKKVYSYINNNRSALGKYTKNSNGKILFKGTDDCDPWTQYGNWYFSSMEESARTICNDSHIMRNYSKGTVTGASDSSSICGVKADSLSDINGCTARNGCYKGATYDSNFDEPACVEYEDGDCVDYSNKGTTSLGTYYPDSDGFKRNQHCEEKCVWKKKSGSRTCTFSDWNEAEKAYTEDVGEFVASIKECLNAASKCKDESVTYIMSANDDIEKEKTKQTCDTSNYQSNDLCRKFPSDKGQEQSKLTYVDVTDTDSTKWVTGGNKYPSVVELNAGSCANQIKDKNYDWTGTPTLTLETKYHSIITFPGAWIGNKHGDVVYDNSKIEEKWYQKVTGKYCTPLTAEPVNTDYWTKYQLARYGCTDGVKEIKNTTNYVYNILSDIKNFGNFEWTFNTGCFYGVNKNANVVVPSDYTCPSPSPCKPGEACPPTTCVGNKCDSTKNCNGSTTTPECDTSYGNFDVRSNANSDMFPSKTSNTGKGGTVSTSTKTYKSGNKVKAEKIADNDTISSASTTIGRTPGFNWTVNASNLSVAGYPVTPTLLIQKVQDPQYNAYSNDELDYEFYISKNNIKNIRDLKGNDAKFNNFGNSKYKDNYDTTLDNHEYRKIYADAGYKDSDIPTVTFYYSGFIRDTAFVSASSDDGKYTSKYASEQSRKCNNMKGSAVGASGGCDDLTAYYSTDGNQLKNFIDGAAADLTK